MRQNEHNVFAKHKNIIYCCKGRQYSILVRQVPKMVVGLDIRLRVIQAKKHFCLDPFTLNALHELFVQLGVTPQCCPLCLLFVYVYGERTGEEVEVPLGPSLHSIRYA